MSWNDPRSAADQPTDAISLLTALIETLGEQIQALSRTLEQHAHRLGTVEQMLYSAQQDAADARQLAMRPSSDTDRALAYLLSEADAVVLQLEPNGQVVAHAVAEPFYLHSKHGWKSPWIRTARSEVGERAGGALISLRAYIYSQKTDEFATDGQWESVVRERVAPRQDPGEDENGR